MKNPPICDYEGSDYQQRFWESSERRYEDAAEAMALKRLLPTSGKHLLEIGAGAGRNTPRYIGFEHITLLDYSTTQLQQAIQKLGFQSCYKFIAADVYRLPFAPAVFDAATMIRTLHHLSEPLSALRQINQCLVSGAVFILEFANKRNLKSILRYWLGKQHWNPFSTEAVEFAELNFDFHPASVHDMLEESEFFIEKQVGVSYLRTRFFKRILPLWLMLAKESILQNLASWTALSPSIFLRARVKQTDYDEGKTNINAIFRCPACGHYPLKDTPPKIICSRCGRFYPVTEGVYDFRLTK